VLYIRLLLALAVLAVLVQALKVVALNLQV
jgi:hypothetical protein